MIFQILDFVFTENQVNKINKHKKDVYLKYISKYNFNVYINAKSKYLALKKYAEIMEISDNIYFNGNVPFLGTFTNNKIFAIKADKETIQYLTKSI